MTDFAEFIATSRQQLLGRADIIRFELSEIEIELAAIDAYEQAKQERQRPRMGRPRGTGRYPHRNDGTLSVPEAGREFLGLSASGSWLAARSGKIPAVRIGRFRRVPIDDMRRKLEELRPAAQ